MNQTIVTEEEFFELHNRLKDEGFTIIRCIEISGTKEGKAYQLVWV